MPGEALNYLKFEAIPIGLAEESRESLYGRETDRDLRIAPRHVDASRDFLFYFLRTSSVWGVRCQSIFPFFFPCSADHERDWPPCKYSFVGNQ